MTLTLYQNDLCPIAELDGDGNVVSRFVYAMDSNVPDYIIKGGTTYRIITDHLGSPRIVVNSNTSEIVQRMDYMMSLEMLHLILILDSNPSGLRVGYMIKIRG